MHYLSINRPKAPSAVVEALEPRQFLSVATTATVTLSAKSAVLGEAITLTIHVKPSKGTLAANGTVELLSSNKATGLTAKLDSKGEYTVSFTPMDALFIHDFSLSARYLGTKHFAGTKSKAVKLNVTAPIFTTAKDGLGTAIVKAGKGTATVQPANRIEIADTGYASDGSLVGESGTQGNGFETLDLTSTKQSAPAFYQGILGMKVGETIVIKAPPSLVANSNGKTYFFIVQLKAILH